MVGIGYLALAIVLDHSQTLDPLSRVAGRSEDSASLNQDGTISNLHNAHGQRLQITGEIAKIGVLLRNLVAYRSCGIPKDKCLVPTTPIESAAPGPARIRGTHGDHRRPHHPLLDQVIRCNLRSSAVQGVPESTPSAPIVRVPNETAYTIRPLQQIVFGHKSRAVSASLEYPGGIPSPVTFRVPQRLARAESPSMRAILGDAPIAHQRRCSRSEPPLTPNSSHHTSGVCWPTRLGRRQAAVPRRSPCPFYDLHLPALSVQASQQIESFRGP